VSNDQGEMIDGKRMKMIMIHLWEDLKHFETKPKVDYSLMSFLVTLKVKLTRGFGTCPNYGESGKAWI
jgi:hypothetical protein